CHKARNASRKTKGRGKALPPVIVAPVEAKPKKKPVHWQQRIHPDIAYERDIKGVKTNTILEGLTPPGVDYSHRPYPGAPVEQQDWQIYATKISAIWQDTWQKAVPGIIETGKLLIEAKSRVSHTPGDFKNRTCSVFAAELEHALPANQGA